MQLQNRDTLLLAEAYSKVLNEMEYEDDLRVKPQEPGKDYVTPIVDLFTQLDGDQVEDLFNRLSGYFKTQADDEMLSNMDAYRISEYLSAAADLVAARDSN